MVKKEMVAEEEEQGRRDVLGFGTHFFLLLLLF